MSLTQPPTTDDFRRTVSWFVTGVAVMTSVDANGQPHAMTANAVSSLSLDPPLVLVCVARDASMAQVVQSGQLFALSFLSADQRSVSDHFANPDRGYGVVEFDGVATSAGVTGAPLLDGAAAWMDCELHDVLPGGDHLIVVGKVVGTGISEAASSLMYTPRGYDRWQPPES
jgi:flavin reductase (DIM6/NTAB) family NADH-FMN oxidoreductase RutF